jgi:plastocyanin
LKWGNKSCGETAPIGGEILDDLNSRIREYVISGVDLLCYIVCVFSIRNPYSGAATKLERLVQMKVPSAVILLAVLLPVQSFAKDITVDQKDKQFTMKSLKIKVGDSVTFRNSDPFAHNIFSLSDVQAFDLGSYPQGQSKVVKFDNPGKVEVECSIHPTMQMVVEVEK